MFQKKARIILAVVIIISCMGIGLMVWESSDHSIFYTLKSVFHKQDTATERKYPIEDLEDYQGETVTLVIYDGRTDYNGIQEGWFAKILQDQFNIKLDIRGVVDAPDAADCDLNIWSSRKIFEDTDTAALATLDADFLEKYGICINQEYSKNLIPVGGDKDAYYGVEDRNTVPGVWTIGKNSRHKELALCFMDWMASEEGMQTCTYGPKEVCWNYDKDGNVAVTSFGWKCKENAGTKMPEEFGDKDWGDGRPRCSLMRNY